ncbi:NUDIX domain-containing protein [Candidatus Bipolaricaulota bacterium]|nr:NUDIX domain-containing protein [Candidatus Bipolaricaulota bacterium]
MKQAGGFSGGSFVTAYDPITPSIISHSFLLPGSQELIETLAVFNGTVTSDLFLNVGKFGVEPKGFANRSFLISPRERVGQLYQSRRCFTLFINMPQYYVETDGKIYLTESGKVLKFPRSREEIPFEIRPKSRMVVESKEIVYSEPVLSYHPQQWLNKEDVPLMDDVDPIVRKAVNFSLPRLVVEAVIRDSDKVLLVKPSRGYNEDRWTLPGGFLVYGETPAEAVRREVEEEVGAKPSIAGLVNVYSTIGAENSYQWVIFYFSAKVPGDPGDLRPNHEIKQLRWFDTDEAAEAIHSPVMQNGFRQIFDEDKGTA